MTDAHAGAHGAGPGKMFGVYLGQVTDVKDDKHQGKVQVKLLAHDGVTTQSTPMWAWVAVPFAGANRGAFLIPSKDDIVVVQFVHGEPSQAIVTGGVWTGSQQAPETLGGDGSAVDRWTIVGKAGTRVAIVEEAAGATISLTTPHSTESVTITAQSSGKIELKTSTSTITMDSSGIAMKTTTFKLDASDVTITAPTVTIDGVEMSCTGLVKGAVVQTPSVIGTTYTPGAGNIW